MLKLKSITFSLIFYLWISLSMIFFLPFIFFYKIIYLANSYFARSVAWLLKYIVGIDYRIEGLENLPIGKLETRNCKLKTGSKSLEFRVQSSEILGSSLRGGDADEAIQSKSSGLPRSSNAFARNDAVGESPKEKNSNHRVIESSNHQQNPKGFVIASKHQSAWETIIAFAFLPKVSFVYKKELGYIPIYGWYNKAYKNICADRKGGAKALKSIVEQTKNRVEHGHQVIIFPQGTRTAFGRVVPYKSSVYAMYKEALDIYPAALNSGNFWPKKGVKKSGTIVWKFLPPIEQGLDKKQFMQRLEEVIESESNKLNA